AGSAVWGGPFERRPASATTAYVTTVTVSSLSPAERRVALLEERGHRFRRVLRREVDVLGLCLGFDRLRERHGRRLVQQTLAHRERDGRAGREPLGPLVDEGVELGGGHDAVHDAVVLRFLGVDDLGQQ